jgi:hypothetical protein
MTAPAKPHHPRLPFTWERGTQRARGLRAEFHVPTKGGFDATRLIGRRLSTARRVPRRHDCEIRVGKAGRQVDSRHRGPRASADQRQRRARARAPDSRCIGGASARQDFAPRFRRSLSDLCRCEAPAFVALGCRSRPPPGPLRAARDCRPATVLSCRSRRRTPVPTPGA